MKIYLAGPLFSESERAFLDVIARRLRGEGYAVFVPHENFAERKFQSSESTAIVSEVYSTDLAGIEGSNAVLAWIDGPVCDDGTAVEIGIFNRLVLEHPDRYRGIVALSTDIRVARRRGLIPGDGINVFLAGAVTSCGEVVWSIEEALLALGRLRDRVDIAACALGKAVTYADKYDSTLLFPIARNLQRAKLGVASPLPFGGVDYWTAYEVGWLSKRGKPEVAILRLSIPCETPNIIESKSLKLYLNSFNGTRFDGGAEEVEERIRADVNEAAWRGASARGASATAALILRSAFHREAILSLEGTSLDDLDVECTHFTPTPELLVSAAVTGGEPPVSETLTTHLFKSNCLVTGQPDWASVQVSYTGPKIDGAGLLRYLVSFRDHNEFHEHCVERIFLDVWTRCGPSDLAVHAQFTRRGGIDISPFRTSNLLLAASGVVASPVRHARQ